MFVTVEHLKILVSDFKERFSYLKQIYFPLWVIHTISDVSVQYQKELSEIK